VMRGGLSCEPCWFGNRFHACAKRIDCLRALSVETVRRLLRELMGFDAAEMTNEITDRVAVAYR
jgi:hypothetical protein